MEAKEAIAIAKIHVSDLFGPEGATNIGLEELTVSGSGTSKIWRVTVGFSRPWDSNNTNSITNILNVPQYKRTYKVVSISDDTGKVESITNRASDSAL